MRTLAISMIACAVVLLPHTARPATFTVNSTDDGVDSAPGDGVCVGPAGTCTLRGAILEANALAGADTIALPAGKFSLQFPGADEDAGWKGDLDITDDLVINGAGETASVINGHRIDRVFDVRSPAQVTLADLTITNGEPPTAEAAGGMWNGGTVTLTNVTFFRNQAGRGEGWGGAMENVGTATLTHVTFHHNHAGNAYANPHSYSDAGSAGSVGGMSNFGTATLTDVTFRANRSGDGVDSEENRDGGNIGGLLNEGTATLTNVTFSTNRAGDGSKGEDPGYGGSVGGMENDGTATLTKVTFDRNRAGNGAPTEGYPQAGDGGDGGGMLNSGTATLTDVSFIGNRAGDGGGGGTGGSNGGGGGGMWNDGTATLTNATFARNRAGGGHLGSGGDGGGMLDFGAATLINVTMTRNHAGNGAGRGYYYGTGGFGGGLITYSATLTNVTLALNRAGRNTYRGPQAHNGEGNQIYGDAKLTNTIVFGAGGSCVLGGFSSMGHNLDSGTACGFAATGDLSNTDPLLGTLKSNGGFTQTMALRSGSPAIDAGDNAVCPTTDQRGIARPQGAACDIGAYEVEP